MTSKAIRQYPIVPILDISSIDNQLENTLLASVAEYHEQLHGRRIWLACSGGRDSLALAALCLQLYRQGRLPFLPQLLHVNHGLQADSDYWAQHVATWAQAQQMPCYILRATVNGHDEQAARQARYRVMLAYINQDDVLLLAHHADDQAETVLMRLIQGAGVKGLSGMQAWREQSNGTRRNSLWRPWLTVTRTAITAYAEQLKLPYIDDPTNESGDNVRSGLRRDIMPALATYNPNVINNIARSGQLLSDAQAIVHAQAEQDLQKSAVEFLSYPPAQRVLSIDEMQTLPLYRQRQLLHSWLAQDEPLPPSKQLVDDVLGLSQRHDHNHKTELDWHANAETYSIRRYHQQLSRLSHSFVEWLTLPISEQTLELMSIISPRKNSETITLRSNVYSIWQLQFTQDNIARLLKQYHLHEDSSSNSIALINNEASIILKIAPLDRHQRVQTTFATRPQAGKKLMQTLGIPVWLRDSLVVVSVVLNSDEELPLLLLSPFDSWILGFNKSEADITSHLLDSGFSNILQIHQCGSN
ncbi:tRNA lysidine(34) synthetase TilS [Psychrobacter frigidicola]|uniref:tRNA(Ile)-lysidine synthase n=1 Tax=Psychrobacter frigidicola TaxID=45611 RepID=A0A5C7A188_9GAMM|nr:tRNA lysidine(34) synthetase TilS [Psychrobacter frigidicola]